MKHKRYDVIVVGGGPAGSMAAWEVAKSGASVCLLEKDRDIGYPVRCGEAVGESGLKQFVEPKESWIASKMERIKLVAPNGSEVQTPFNKEKGYILNRRIFDYDLSRYAANAGADIYTKSYVKGLKFNNGYVSGVTLDFLGEEMELDAKIVIGADGISSRIGRWAGLKTSIRMKDMESCVQYSVSNIDIDSNEMVMYIGKDYAPGGYLWIFPKGERFANIGLGISGKYSKHRSAKSYLDEFMEKNFPEASVLTTMCGGVPCPKIMKEPIADGLMLVGDAAHQINPMTGGGIVSGMKGGWIAGQVAGQAINKSDYSANFLSEYSNRVNKDFGKNHDRFYRIKEVVNSFNDEDLDIIAEKVLKTPMEKRSITKIFQIAVFRKPSIVLDVLKVFAGA